MNEREVMVWSQLIANCRETENRDVRLWAKVGQIGTKWEKSGTFSGQISVILARQAELTVI